MDAGRLLAVARDSIRAGLERGRPLPVRAAPGDPLAVPAACFVSLHVDDELRGCIGTTEPSLPLVEQVAEYAYAAAFRDPRFPPLARGELDALTLEIHVLSPLELLPFRTLPDLYAQLRPGIDGLQLEHGARRALFLPVMWEQLTSAEVFVDQLLRKGGITATSGLTARRFTAQVLRER